MTNTEKYIEIFGLTPNKNDCPPIYNGKLCPDHNCSECREWWNQEYSRPKEMTPLTIVLQEVADEVCTNLCKYTETTDEDCVCDYMREHGYCPLERLV